MLANPLGSETSMTTSTAFAGRTADERFCSLLAASPFDTSTASSRITGIVTCFCGEETGMLRSLEVIEDSAFCSVYGFNSLLVDYL